MASILEPTPYSIYHARTGVFVDATRASSEYGVVIFPYVPGCKIYGMQLYTHKAGAHQIRIKLYLPDGGAAVRSETFDFSGAGHYTCRWAAGPYEVTQADMILMRAGDYDASFMITQYDPAVVGHTVNNTNRWYSATGWHVSLGQLAQNLEQATAYLSGGGEGRPKLTYGVNPCLDPLVEPAVLTYQPTPQVHSVGGRPLCVAVAGGRTTGSFMAIQQPCAVHGIRCYSAVAGAHTLRGTLWRPGVWTVAATADLPVAGPGFYDILFATPYTIPWSELGWTATTYTDNWYFGVYETSGSFYTADPYVGISIEPYGLSSMTFPASVHTDYGGDSQRYSAGDARPTTNTADLYPVAPLIIPTPGPTP